MQAPSMQGNDRALLQAAESGDLEALKQQLLYKGGKMNECKDSGGLSPLHKAAQNGHLSIVTWLVENGANIDAQAGNGSTPLMKSAQYNRADILAWLIDKGADVTARTKQGHTVKDYALDTQVKASFLKGVFRLVWELIFFSIYLMYP